MKPTAPFTQSLVDKFQHDKKGLYNSFNMTVTANSNEPVPITFNDQINTTPEETEEPVASLDTTTEKSITEDESEDSDTVSEEDL
jgi:hypothetical protein